MKFSVAGLAVSSVPFSVSIINKQIFLMSNYSEEKLKPGKKRTVQVFSLSELA